AGNSAAQTVPAARQKKPRPAYSFCFTPDLKLCGTKSGDGLALRRCAGIEAFMSERNMGKPAPPQCLVMGVCDGELRTGPLSCFDLPQPPKAGGGQPPRA